MVRSSRTTSNRTFIPRVIRFIVAPAHDLFNVTFEQEHIAVILSRRSDGIFLPCIYVQIVSIIFASARRCRRRHVPRMTTAATVDNDNGGYFVVVHRRAFVPRKTNTRFIFTGILTGVSKRRARARAHIHAHTYVHLANDKPCFIAASLKGFVRRANDGGTDTTTREGRPAVCSGRWDGGTGGEFALIQ